MSNRENAHALLDRVPDADIPIVERILKGLTITAHQQYVESLPIDDEELTGQCRAELKAGLADASAGIPHDEVLKEFGRT